MSGYRRQPDESTTPCPRRVPVVPAPCAGDETTINDSYSTAESAPLVVVPSTTTDHNSTPPSTQRKHDRRPICAHCQRPTPAACICAALPTPRLTLRQCHCWILQHPHEPRRKNRSLPLVELCLDETHLTVVQGRRLCSENPHVQRLLRDAAAATTDVWLLSPGNGAISLKEALEKRKLASANGTVDGNKKLTLLFLDATWKVRTVSILFLIMARVFARMTVAIYLARQMTADYS